MDEITPAVVSASDVLNGTKCDGIELTTNLFKDHKMSTDDQKTQRLDTYLRIRSIASNDNKDKCFKMMDTNTLLVIPPKGSNANKFGSDSDRKVFTFTKIFDQLVDQSVVYESFALPLVKRFLGGQNGLLFAYGITSSGKSYTMRGTTANPGVIPRSLSTLFEVIGLKIQKVVPNLKPNTFTDCTLLSQSDRELEEDVRRFVFENTDKSCGLLMNSFRSQMSVINETMNQSLLWNPTLHSTFRSEESSIRCSVWITFYEIYNEMIYDLLDLEITGEKKQKIWLLKDESDNYYVKGLRQIFVSTPEEAFKVLLFGQNNLHISSTSLNDKSSRSHCAFNITLVSTYTNCRTNGSEYAINHLSICDLAGAERSVKANNAGERIKEAGKINGSLLSLSRCISTIRHNQKYEHEPSKTRFVNFRDSKLTKVFQPFLSGRGTAAMISNMNPSAHVFDETLFALKFTGIASQVIVTNEVQRTRVHDSLKRLTEVWMLSSKRWSDFAHLKPSKPSVSIVQTIQEEEEDDDNSDECLDITAEGFERKIDEMTNIMDKSTADPQELEVMKTQIDFLVEKLKQSETDKFEMEMEVRKQVVSEFNKLIKDMEDMAEDKDRSKRKLEDMMSQRLINIENIHKKEKLKFESKIETLNKEVFELNEKFSCVCDEKERAVTEAELLHRVLSDRERVLSDKENRIQELESQLNDRNGVKELKCYKDVNTSPVKPLLRDVNTSPVKWLISDANTSTLNVSFKDVNTSALNVSHRDANTSTLNESLKDANNSVIDLIERKDSNTSAIDFDSQPIVQLSDKSVQSSVIESKEIDTSTQGLNEMSDKSTCASIEGNNKSTFIENELFVSEDKETSNLIRLSDTTILVEEPNEPKHVNTSTESPQQISNDNFVAKQKYNELIAENIKLENALKENEGVIDFNRKIVRERDQKLSALEEENRKLKERLKTNTEINFDIFKPKSTSTTSSVTSSISITSKSVKSEDLLSISSMDSLQDKPKKTLKYSSHKRKPNSNNSSEKRYFNCESIDTTLEDKLSQTSATSVESCIADEIGDDVYSTKKSNKRTVKRKQNNDSLENEVYTNKGKEPVSKRKRPPLQNLYSSPISPIPSARVVTRSKAKKCLNFK